MTAGRWPGGLTHHVVGGHYGYPYQFLVAPFRTLPVIGGEVGGAGAQAVCYLEDGLPARYRAICSPAMRPDRRSLDGCSASPAGPSPSRSDRDRHEGEAADFRPVALAPIAEDPASGSWTGAVPTAVRRPGLSAGLYGQRSRPAGPRPGRDDAAARIAALDHPAGRSGLPSQRSLARKESQRFLSSSADCKPSSPRPAVCTRSGHSTPSITMAPGRRSATRSAIAPRGSASRGPGVAGSVATERPSGAGGHCWPTRPGRPARGGHRAGEDRRTPGARAPVAALGDSDRFAAWSIRARSGGLATPPGTRCGKPCWTRAAGKAP